MTPCASVLVEWTMFQLAAWTDLTDPLSDSGVQPPPVTCPPRETSLNNAPTPVTSSACHDEEITFSTRSCAANAKMVRLTGAFLLVKFQMSS
ncbi:hypothetical protein Hte_002561 [Hypoxylon texense]